MQVYFDPVSRDCFALHEWNARYDTGLRHRPLLYILQNVRLTRSLWFLTCNISGHRQREYGINLIFSERELITFTICRRKSVCLSVVCLSLCL